MKMKWRRAMLILALALAAGAGGVHAEAVRPPDEPPAVAEGRRMAEQMRTMAGSEAWVRFHGRPGPEVRALLSEAGGTEDDALTAVYRVRLSDGAVRLLSGGRPLETLPASLREQGRRNGERAAGMFLNSLEGTCAVAAAGLCAAEEAFVDRTLDGSAMYLYVYRHSAPVLVTFLEGRDHAVLATGCFLFGRTGEALDTEDAVRESFHGFFEGIETVSGGAE